ncbi:MAG: hypothetical protein AAFV33_19610 [Chloroflexota bacterium]
MSGLLIRRLFVVSVSSLVGFFATLAIFELVFPILIPQEGPKTMFEDYGWGYTFLTALPIALFVMAWLDYFMDTRIHAD